LDPAGRNQLPAGPRDNLRCVGRPWRGEYCDRPCAGRNSNRDEERGYDSNRVEQNLAGRAAGKPRIFGHPPTYDIQRVKIGKLMRCAFANGPQQPMIDKRASSALAKKPAHASRFAS
jgi:hypothetical protein